MNTPITSWISLMLDQAQRCHHLAWFLYGCAAREQALNLNAFAAWWGAWGGPAARRSPGPGTRACVNFAEPSGKAPAAA